MLPEGTYRLVYDDVPRSVNAGGGGSRANAFAAHREKMMWEGVFGMLLMVAKVPRNLTHARITVELQFKSRRARDAENYRHPIVKPLLDAMVKGGWLKDDTEDYVEVERVYMLSDTLDAPAQIKSRMVVTIQCYRLTA